MTNVKTIRKALFTSLLSLLLCFSMLVGTTFAWFTDSVSSTNNIIKAGNLDVELEYLVDGSWKDVNGADDVLTNKLWEPGVTEVAYLKLKNAGTLAFKYQFGINIVSEIEGVNKANEQFKLSDYIMFGVIEGLNGESNAFTKDDAGRDAAIAAVTEAKKISAGYLKADSMASGAELYIALVVYMPTEVANEANHNGVKIPQIDLGINVFATQYTSEEDSFGGDYDGGAAFVSAPVARPDNAVNDMNIKGVNDVVVGLTSELINALPEEVKEIGMAVSDPVVESDRITFQSIELVDQDGNIIDLEELDLGEKITVTLTLPQNAPFVAGDEVLIYHDNTYVATAIVAVNGTISYSVEHLCEVTIGTVEEPTINETTNVIEIANVAQFITFANNVNAGNSYKGKTVVLTNNINLNNVAWTPIGSESNPFKGVFDGNNYTISNLYINKVESDCVALFGFIGTTTIKNFTIDNVNAHGLQRVAAVVGATSSSAVIDNVHVTGDISIVADKYYAAGIVTHGYVNVTNCSIIAESANKGYINGNGGMVGGICGWRGEGKTVITNCHVKNIDMIGRASIGGLAALIHYDNTISDCSVENVTLTKTRVDGWGSIGALCGNWGGVDKAGTAVYTVTNNTIKNVTLNGTAIKIFSEIYGSKYSAPEADMPLVESGNTFENINSNLSLVTAVSTAEELKAALKDDAVIFINGDISDTTIKLPSKLKNVTIKAADNVSIKNSTIMSADGNSLNYDGLTFDGIVFDNSNIVLTGMRSGSVIYKDLSITNCVFKNIERTSNYAAVHMNMSAKEAVENFTFVNNVIDGVTGSSNNALTLKYLTGNITISDNTIKNVALYPFNVMIATDDGVSDELVVTNNTFSNNPNGRLQVVGNNEAGTDMVKFVINNNIISGITKTYFICCWQLNSETLSADISQNYFDVDVATYPDKIYVNSEALSVEDLKEMGLSSYYTKLNEDGTINKDSLVVLGN